MFSRQNFSFSLLCSKSPPVTANTFRKAVPGTDHRALLLGQVDE